MDCKNALYAVRLTVSDILYWSVLILHKIFLCESNTKEVFTIDFNILLRDFCLFILGIYGTKIFDYLHTLVQKREVRYVIFLTVSFIVVHMLFAYL